jgi:hypothetical protein
LYTYTSRLSTLCCTPSAPTSAHNHARRPEQLIYSGLLAFVFSLAPTPLHTNCTRPSTNVYSRSLSSYLNLIRDVCRSLCRPLNTFMHPGVSTPLHFTTAKAGVQTPQQPFPTDRSIYPGAMGAKGRNVFRLELTQRFLGIPKWYGKAVLDALFLNSNGVKGSC